MTKKDSPLARAVGSTLAHVQHGLDRVIAWGFDRMQKAAEARKEPAKERTSAVGKLQRAGKTFLRFVGQAGKSYYRAYDDLKQKGKKEQE